MDIIAADMIAAMRELPLLAVLALTGCGFVLWLAGWWSHRFWATLACTIGAGIYGLQRGPEFGLKPVISGILLAVAGGALALSMARLAIFAVSGFACWWLAQALFPHWAVPVVCLVVGGLIGLLFFRFWVTLATSALGAVVLGHCVLVLAAKIVPTFDAASWCAAKVALLNALLAGATLAGLIAQYFLDKLAGKISSWRTSLKEEKPKEKKAGFFGLRKAG
jgi:MFS family permease